MQSLRSKDKLVIVRNYSLARTVEKKEQSKIYNKFSMMLLSNYAFNAAKVSQVIMRSKNRLKKLKAMRKLWKIYMNNLMFLHKKLPPQLICLIKIAGKLNQRSIVKKLFLQNLNKRHWLLI